MVLALAHAAHAKSRATQAAPRFTLAEEVIIARNDALNEVLKIDPWGVRKIIDAMATAKQRPAGSPPERQRDLGEQRDGAVHIDPGRNIVPRFNYS